MKQYILCLETATTNCSVAIGESGKIVALREDNNDQYSHAEKLHVFIDELLSETGLEPGDLSAVAVSEGPGSYTGLRIGVSAAKGLCFALGIPFIAIPTLLSLAHQVEAKEGDYIIPLLDARRMEVYTAGFTKNRSKVFEIRAEVLNSSSFDEFLEKGRVSFIGSGVKKFQEICSHPNANMLLNRLPSAAQMIALAQEKFLAQDFEDVAYFEPQYLKDFMPG